MELTIDGVKVVKIKEIRDKDMLTILWETNIRLPDGDFLVLYEKVRYYWGLETISFNPFNGIPSHDICVDSINLGDAQKLLGVNNYDEDIVHLAVAIKLAKKILNL
jgi:hypothetical protein